MPEVSAVSVSPTTRFPVMVGRPVAEWLMTALGLLSRLSGKAVTVGESHPDLDPLAAVLGNQGVGPLHGSFYGCFVGPVAAEPLIGEGAGEAVLVVDARRIHLQGRSRPQFATDGRLARGRKVFSRHRRGEVAVQALGKAVVVSENHPDPDPLAHVLGIQCVGSLRGSVNGCVPGPVVAEPLVGEGSGETVLVLDARGGRRQLRTRFQVSRDGGPARPPRG